MAHRCAPIAPAGVLPVGLGAQVLLAVGAITLAVEAGGGLYWWPAGVTAAYVSALTNAWVLLIEILR